MVVKMMNYNIGKNIKSLRAAYGETQMELAFALGLDSPSTIANYEKGTRNPESKILQKIAKHYRITEVELMHCDFSKLSFGSFSFDDKEKIQDMTETMLPVICTKEALADPLFKKGYHAHMRAYEAMKKGIEYNENDYNVCIKSYLESFESFGTLESVANCLWWFLLASFAMTNAQLLDGVKALNNKKISSKDLLKNYYLHNSSEDLFDEDDVEYSKEHHKILAESENIIVEFLRELKSSPQWSNLADYYTALRYLFCIVNNDLSDNMNRAVGEEMMCAFVMLENPYAQSFLKKGIEYSKK